MMKPNTALYCWLFVGAVVLSLLCLFIPKDSPWFTIISGIGCGGVASVIVAWLLDTYNCKLNRFKAVENRNILFKKLFFSFENGLQLLIFESEQYQHDELPRKWYEWVDFSYNQTKKYPDFCKTFNRTMLQFFNGVYEQARLVQAQEAVLLKNNIVTSEDIDTVATMVVVCELAQGKFNSRESEAEIAKHYVTDSLVLRNRIDCSAAMKQINEILIEPKLYTLSLQYKQAINRCK